MRTNLTHFPIDDEIGATRAITTLSNSHGITENPAIAKQRALKQNEIKSNEVLLGDPRMTFLLVASSFTSFPYRLI